MCAVQALHGVALCSGPFRRYGFQEYIRSASLAGFGAVTLSPSDLPKAEQEGLDLDDVGKIIQDSGLRVAYIDGLTSWSSGAATRYGRRFARTFAVKESVFFELAHRLDTGLINAVDVGGDARTVGELAEQFGGLCERALSQGLRVSFEFVPWTPLGQLGSATALLRQVRQPNAGLLIDTWHLARSGWAPSEPLRSDDAPIFGVQLSGAQLEVWADPVEETLSQRTLPDEPAALPVSIAVLQQALSEPNAVMSAEVYSSALARLPSRRAAFEVADSMRRLQTRLLLG